MTEKKQRAAFNRLVKDPLFHFLILGAIISLCAHYWSGGKVEDKNSIFISQLSQKHLADLFEITWQRTPNQSELSSLIEEHIKEEVYYREALALGLDDNDTIVRRRMRQKLEFMHEDFSSNIQPTEVQLEKYYDANRDKYFTDRIVSFEQMLVSSKRLPDLAPELALVRKEIENGHDPKRLSRSTLLPTSMKLEREKTIRNTFGDKFLKQLSTLKHDHWDGPVYSAFGTHMVNVQLDQSAQPLDFTAARASVSSDYMQAQREQAAENYFAALKAQYRIVVEKP